MDDALDMEALGQAIAERRRRLNLNTHRLAQRAGIPDPYLRRIEAGQTGRIGLETLMKVARALGLTLDELLRQSGLIHDPAPKGDLDAIYQALLSPERRALLRIGEVLRDLQDEREDGRQSAQPVPHDPLPTEPRAAYSEPIPPLEEEE